MIVKFVSVSVIICILSNCFANCSANECLSEDWRSTSDLSFNCEQLRKFESCANEIAPNGNVTKVDINCLELNDFPTEVFRVFPSIKGLTVASSPHLTQRDLLGANQLEYLFLNFAEFNLASSTFVNAPKLKALGIQYADVAYIDPQTFNGASALRILTLKIVSRAPLPEGLFDGLANLQVLEIFRSVGKPRFDNKIDIETLGIPVDNKIKLLKLAFCTQTELKAEMMVNFPQLTMLLLVDNVIQRIQSYTFARTNQLILLDLSGNKIEELTRPMLAGLTNLRTANFRANEIRNIESEAFLSTPQLRRLDLSLNKMLTLEPHTLNSLVKIRHLEVSINFIRSTVDLSLFCNLPYISYVDLWNAGISKLKKCVQSSNSAPIDLIPKEPSLNSPDTEELLSDWQYLGRGLNARFIGSVDIDLAYIDGMNHERKFLELLDGHQNTSTGGSKLSVLNLAWNHLSDWEDNIFDNLVNLRALYLDNNPIESLRSGQFNGLGSLLILRLTSCKLTSLNFNVFSPLVNLKQLHLTGNFITTITPPTMSMNRLTVLELSYNKLPPTSLSTEAFRKSFNWDILHLFI